MKLSTYIEECRKILKKYGDLDVIYASDDEGNDYNLVHHTPCVGEYENREFTGRAECVSRGIKFYFNKREHTFSTTELRQRVVEAEADKLLNQRLT